MNLSYVLREIWHVDSIYSQKFNRSQKRIPSFLKLRNIIFEIKTVAKFYTPFDNVPTICYTNIGNPEI